MSHQSQQLYEFGPFRLDVMERRLLLAGETVALTPKAFDLLLVLIERKAHLLEKDELLKLVWPDTFVEEANLPYNISLIRKALGDAENGQHYIETVPKRGYRFIASVREVREESAEQIARPGTKDLINQIKQRKLALGTWTHGSEKAVDSLAILPFVNASADQQAEYLSNITESLIINLSQLPNLRVIARTTVFRYKGQAIDPNKVGRDLKVRAVLTGKVLQRGDALIIQADLVDEDAA
jgi:DNA-binding winged helix-turn-helix (wHTH) protein